MNLTPVAIIDYKTFPMFPSHYGCYLLLNVLKQ